MHVNKKINNVHIYFLKLSLLNVECGTTLLLYKNNNYDE